MKTLFVNCDILLSDGSGFDVIKNGYLGVDGDTISYIGKTLPTENYDIKKDMTGRILMPGLYNCHTHSPMVLLRGVGSDLPLDKWLFDKVCPIEDKLTAGDIKAGSYLALMEMIACGTVSFSDMYFEPAVTVEAVAASGLKANICRPVQAFSPDDKPEDSYRIKESLELFDRYNGYADNRVLIDFCIHAEYTCNENVARYYSELCSRNSGNMHIHLSETQKEHDECIARYGITPTEWFEAIGAFDAGAFAAHCVTLSDNDIGILKKHKVSVVHNPSSNLKLGSGIAPIQKYIDLGLNVAIGTDGAASNNNLDMFEEMHMAALINNGVCKDATVMKAETVLRLATENGAVLQRRKHCGKLAVGYKADIIAVSTDKPHMHPCLDVPALLVYSAQGGDVVMTMCEGKILYENGEYKTIDSERIYFEVNKTIERLYR